MVNDLIPWVDSQFPHHRRQGPPRHGRPFDGRHADRLRHHGQPRQVLLHRLVQRRRRRWRPRGGRRGGAAPATPPAAAGAAATPTAATPVHPSRSNLQTIYSGAMANPDGVQQEGQGLLLQLRLAWRMPRRLEDRTSNNSSPPGSPTATSIFRPARRTNGRRGDAACMALPRCCSAISIFGLCGNRCVAGVPPLGGDYGTKAG